MSWLRTYLRLHSLYLVRNRVDEEIRAAIERNETHISGPHLNKWLVVFAKSASEARHIAGSRAGDWHAVGRMFCLGSKAHWPLDMFVLEQVCAMMESRRNGRGEVVMWKSRDESE